MKNEAKPTLFRKQRVHPSRVLIVGHDPDNLALIEHYLVNAIPEIEPIKAITEEQVLTYLNACRVDEWRLPRMILLDLLFPLRADGWRMLRRIKELPAPANQVPVVILSNAGDPEDIGKAYDQGGSSYLIKPANESEWPAFFLLLRKYWWETVFLPHTDYRY